MEASRSFLIDRVLPVGTLTSTSALRGCRLLASSFLLLLVLGVLLPSLAEAQFIGANTVYTFKDPTGASPSARLLEASDGYLYGVTSGTGTDADYGTVFRLIPGSKLEAVCHFNGPNGARPAGGLIPGGDGVFYGTTSAGGATFSASQDSAGTIFRLTADGTLTTLHSFSGADGSGPAGALVLSADGTLFGTTAKGGDFNRGSVFRITPAGKFTTLQSFGGTEDGLVLQSGLALGADGNLYGVTAAADLERNVVGRLFRLGARGGFTIVHEFSSSSAELPTGAPTRGADGNIYGVLQGVPWSTSQSLSSEFGGTIYRVLPDGTYSTVYEMHWVHYPIGGLVAAPDGSFYGCLNSDDNLVGLELYHFTPDGTDQDDEKDFTRTLGLYVAEGHVEALPGEFTVGSDGNIYGVFPAGRSDPTEFGGILRVPGPTALPTVYAKGGSVELPDGTGRFTLTLDRPSVTDLVIHYALKGNVISGVDYQPLSGHAKIRAGTTSKIIHVQAQGNLGGAREKVLSLKMQPGDGYNIGTFGKTDIWIYDVSNLPPGIGGDGGTVNTW